MLLVVDIGNTNTVLGLYRGRELCGHWRFETANHRTGDEMHILLHMLLQSIGVSPSEIRGCCLSSVVPQMNTALQEACHKAFGWDPFMVEPGVKTGLVLHCDNPKEVGADRIVNSVGALEGRKPPMIIVDFGTATSFDAITARSEWIGGVIAPGIHLSSEALFQNCAKLPRVDIQVPKSVIGRNTTDNIRSGLTYGYADLVDGLVRRMRAEMDGDAVVVATGGLARVIAPISAEIHHVDPWLTLKGLRVVYEKNVGAVA